MALSQSDLDRLDSAIASAELRVEVDGRSITYRDINQLKEARAHVAAVIGQQAGTGRPRSSFHFTPVLGRDR
jgi:hypothetical protein